MAKTIKINKNERDLFSDNPKILEVMKKAEAHFKEKGLYKRFTFS